jgi:hypothetical protein
MMTRRQANAGILAGAALAAVPTVAIAQELKPLGLPPPRSEGGKPLIAALKLRHSVREYSDRPLPAPVLSNLLWAAFGVNRPSGDRTAPYWRHVMVMDVYVAMADGVWLYEPKVHRLLPHLKDDIRAQTGVSGFRRHRAAQPRLCGPWRTHDGCLVRGASPLCLGRYRLHRPERLSVLRLGGARYGLSGSG